MSRNRILVGIAVVVVVAAVALLWRRGGEEKVRYRLAAAERGTIEAVVSATGTIRPVEQVDVGSQVSGTVYRLHADYNSKVRAGQVLCELEPPRSARGRRRARPPSPAPKPRHANPAASSIGPVSCCPRSTSRRPTWTPSSRRSSSATRT